MEEFIEGMHTVEFTNGETRLIDVLRNIVDVSAHPLYLEDANGKLYNWQNIISIKKER